MVQPVELVVTVMALEFPHWFPVLAAVNVTPPRGAPDASETVLSHTPMDSPAMKQGVL